MGVARPEAAQGQDPRVLELMEPWRRLYAPSYMSDGFVARRVDGFVRQQGWDDDLTGLRADFLLRNLRLDGSPVRNASMGRLFGNFMGTVGALGILADTARLNGEGFVVREDSEGIFRFINLLQRHLPVFGKQLDTQLHNTVVAAAGYYLGAAQELGDILFTMHNRVIKTVDGQVVAPGKIGTGNIERWIEKSQAFSEKLRMLIKGGQLFLTRLGLDELKGWVDQYSRPLGFLHPDIARHAAMDRFGTVDALPAPHPAHAPMVGRVLTDAMMAAEQGDLELRFRWNGWRNSIDIDVPTVQARTFEDVLERGGTSISPSDRRDQHWVERFADKSRLVVPTQGYIALQRFEDIATATVGEVASIVGHLRSINPQETFDPDLPDDTGRSLRDKLGRLNAAVNLNDGMLTQMSGALEGARTQEGRVVREWIARLAHLSTPFLSLHKGLGDSDAFATQRELCLREGMFNLLNHIPTTARRWSIEGLCVEVVQPTPYVKPTNWLDNYHLFLKFYLQAGLIAGAPAEDSTLPRNVFATFAWDPDRSQMIVDNTKDGRLVEFWGGALSAYAAQDMRAVPRLARDIMRLSQRVDPAGVGIGVDRGAGIVRIPMALQQSRSPVEAKFTALGQRGGLAGMPRLPR